MYSSAMIMNVRSARASLPAQQETITLGEVVGPVVMNRTFKTLMSITTLNTEYLHPSKLTFVTLGGRKRVESTSLLVVGQSRGSFAVAGRQLKPLPEKASCDWLKTT